jgi:hypothetical protein
MFYFEVLKENYKVIDIVISQPLDFQKAYERRIVKKINNFNVSLVSLDDLITMKEANGRRKDLDDIQKLREAKQIEKDLGIGL